MSKTLIKVEDMQPLFAKLHQPHTIYRYTGNSGRIYFRINEHEEPMLYLSVTTFIKRTMPTAEQLIKWVADMGYEEAKAYADERANYGTFMHVEFAQLLISGVVDLDGLPDRLAQFIEAEGWPISYMKFVDDLQRDVLALAQFIIDYNVEPLAIEMVLASDKYRFAGALDLVCWMDVEESGNFGEVYKSGDKKGLPKETKRITRQLAIVDAKSGRKQFYDEHVVQLASYKVLFEENFPEHKVQKLFNLSPKDWRTAPGYNLTDQTDKWNVAKFPHMLALAEIDELNPERQITVLKGRVELKDKNLAPLFKTMSFADRIRELKSKELSEKANKVQTEN